MVFVAIGIVSDRVLLLVAVATNDLHQPVGPVSTFKFNVCCKVSWLHIDVLAACGSWSCLLHYCARNWSRSPSNRVLRLVAVATNDLHQPIGSISTFKFNVGCKVSWLHIVVLAACGSWSCVLHSCARCESQLKLLVQPQGCLSCNKWSATRTQSCVSVARSHSLTLTQRLSANLPSMIFVLV